MEPVAPGWVRVVRQRDHEVAGRVGEFPLRVSMQGVWPWTLASTVWLLPLPVWQSTNPGTTMGTLGSSFPLQLLEPLEFMPLMPFGPAPCMMTDWFVGLCTGSL